MIYSTHLVKTYSALVFLLFIGLLSGCDRNVTPILKGNFPLCFGEEALDMAVERLITEGLPGVISPNSACVLPSSGFTVAIIEDRGRMVKIRPLQGATLPHAWTYRENVYNEPPTSIFSLIEAILKNNKASREGFIHPETGQLDHCRFTRSAPGIPLGPDTRCEREARAKGFIRADEYQSRLAKN